MVFKSPGSVAFHTGPLTVYWYGIVIAVAFLAGLFITVKIAKKDYPDDNTAEHIIDLSTYLLIGGVIFARLYYVLFNLGYYLRTPLEAVMTWRGGLSIHGVVIGGILITYFYTKRHNLSLLKYTDLYAYGLIFAQGIGRWGNFFNSEAFGYPTNLPWKLYIPAESRPEAFMGYQYFHPTFLYEFLWDMAVFLILLLVFRRYFKEKTGVVTFAYFILYSLGRFLIEGLRLDNIYFIFGMHIAQFISIIFFIIGIIGFYMVQKKNNARKDT